MSRSLAHLLLLPLSGLLLTAGSAAFGQDDAAPAGDPQVLADQGRALLQTYRKDTTPDATTLATAIDLFSKSKAGFTATGDSDAVAEMEANLAWCLAQPTTEKPVAAAAPAVEPTVALPKTIFTAPAPAVATKRTAFPSEAERKPTIDQVHDLYAVDYRQHSDENRRRLAAKLLREAARNRNDPVAYAAILNEACKVALDGADYLTLIETIDALNTAFTGIDPLAEKQAWLKKATAKTVPTAITTLLTTPQDPPANLVVGRYLAIELGRTADAVPLLALGTDIALRSVAEYDLAASDDGLNAAVTGDGWYQLVKSGTGMGERCAWLQRAQHWYLKARPTAEGLVKKRIETRLAEIDKILPLDLDKLDWKALTPTQWDKLQGVICVVPMRVARSGPLIQLAAGQTVRVVPHPSDQWTLDGRNGKFTSTWTGITQPRAKPNSPPPQALPRPTYRGFRTGELLVQVGENPLQRADLCEGPGALWMVPNRSTTGTSDGEIRVKLIPLDN